MNTRIQLNVWCEKISFCQEAAGIKIQYYFTERKKSVPLYCKWSVVFIFSVINRVYLDEISPRKYWSLMGAYK